MDDKISITSKYIKRLDAMPFDEVGQYLDENLEHTRLDCVNWPEVHSYKPDCQVATAHSDKYLYVYFSVICQDLRAVNTANLSPVAQDSCVEFFMQVPGSDEYWNFEFNCIGTVNASHRVTRPNAVRLTDEQIAAIKRYASCGNEPFDEKHGTFCWDLTVAIPFSLVGIDPANKPSHIMGNFYKCADKTAHPHYVSWAPIALDKPNFHATQFFAPIVLG
ncbi:MAG: carbohydrate-binding family 9-like protein [Bacteroidales bacterium]|nr:carbohydrate-binding family 9-like protein [Bacteroidales bacterium]MDY3912300.1 carbohydrate-binding family 9-like protein [Sodaliphilus sp.]